MTTVLAVDPSLTSTGVVKWQDGRFTVRTIRTMPGDERSARHHRIVMELLAMRDPKPGRTLCSIEGRITPPDGAVQTAMDLAELRGAICLGLFTQGIPRAEVHPSTLKVYATGRGNASKADMLVAARGRLSTHFVATNDDEADAGWICALTLHHYGMPLWRVPATNLRALATTRAAKPGWPAFVLPLPTIG